MDWSAWLDDYYAQYRALSAPEVYPKLVAFRDLAIQVRDRGGKLITAGNGASNAIAAHAALDFTKQGGVRAITISDAALITAYVNDYGYDAWLARAIEAYADDADAVVLISVSGASPNVVEAARWARGRGLPVVTLTGKGDDNALKAEGHISFWVPSAAYNVVECIHMTWLTTVIDMVIGRAEYSVS